MPAPTSAAGAVEGPPRTELQELQLKADQTTDEVRNCLSRSRASLTIHSLFEITYPTMLSNLVYFTPWGPGVISFIQGTILYYYSKE